MSMCRSVEPRLRLLELVADKRPGDTEYVFLDYSMELETVKLITYAFTRQIYGNSLWAATDSEQLADTFFEMIDVSVRDSYDDSNIVAQAAVQFMRNVKNYMTEAPRDDARIKRNDRRAPHHCRKDDSGCVLYWRLKPAQV